MGKKLKTLHKSFYSNLLIAWTPLKTPVFRALWIAAFVSNIGSLMRMTGGSWLITSLTDSTVLVSLMQASASFPLFLLGLPGGALADIVDKRKLLIVGQVWMLLATILLSTLTFMHLSSAWSLIFLTFILGIGNALTLPAWMATLSEVVHKKEFRKAMTLNSLSYNMALVVGPAAAGIILSTFGIAWIFLLNALSFLGVVIVLYRWKREKKLSNLPKEDLLTALRATIRYTKYSPQLRSLLLRTGIIFTFASVFWALIPAVARFTFHMNEGGFGLLFGFMGLGSVIAAIILPKLHNKFSIDKLLTLASILFAFALYLLARPPAPWLAFPAMFIAGMTWLTLASTLNTFVQSIVSSWVRARSIGIYVVIFQAGLALGSMLWGYIASYTGISTALLIASLGLVLGQLAMFKWPLKTAEEEEITPSFHWEQPNVLSTIHPKRGPVLITVSYTIDPNHEKDFMKAINDLSRIRRRDGASQWAIFKDTSSYNRYLENFLVDSWGEHVRQHTRPTFADKLIEEKVNTYLVDGEKPVTTHYIAKNKKHSFFRKAT